MSELSQIPGSWVRISNGVTVRMSASGSPSRWMGEVGDWTWDYVRRTCGVNVYRATNSEGKPSYLAFCYVRMLGSPDFPCNATSPGDELDVVSRGFRGSSDSISVLHEIRGRETAPWGADAS